MDRIKELVELLNRANEAYYGSDAEIMSDNEYDALYDELVSLEKETGIVLSNSPTQGVGHSIVDKLPKEEHKLPMLSLDKTKDINDIKEFLGGSEGVLSWKMDGLTVVLTYDKGKLVKGLTRGTGTIGEVITNNVRAFKNLPVEIKYKGMLTIRGEAIIKYSDFNKLNEGLSPEEQYKNPRNLCSGSVRQLNSKITSQRNVNFYAFTLVEAEGVDFKNKKSNQLKWLVSEGFEVSPYEIVTALSVEDTVLSYKEKIKEFDIPSDGLVISYNDIAYSENLGSTGKFPRDSIAFKWQDEAVTTELIGVIWNTSRTGLINPVAQFKPAFIEGSTVRQASLHNVSILKELELGIGDSISVYKANMIIPQIKENFTRSNNIVIPDKCPVCLKEASLIKVNSSEMLYCTNDDCSAKILKKMVHFTSRGAMNIEGLSEQILSRFIDEGIIREIPDIYRLDRHKEEIVNLKGFGEKSYEKIEGAVSASRKVKLYNFINALGIGGVGLASAKSLSRISGGSLSRVMGLTYDELVKIDGFGEVLARNIFEFFRDEKNLSLINELTVYLEFEESSEKDINEKIFGMTFVITGDLKNFKDREELSELIESMGGKKSTSVSKKTSYLINNDITSNSSKNKKAKELGIPIITEEEFLKMVE